MQKEYEYCDLCGDFHWGEKHHPIFKIYHKGEPDDNPRDMRAYSAYNAAIKYAAQYNNDNEYVLTKGREVEITVLDQHGKSYKFKIYAQPSVIYSAEEID